MILFNDDIYPLANYSLWENFNDTNLKVTIKAGRYSDIKNLNFTWNCTDFSTRHIKLKLSFSNPGLVSIDQDVIDYHIKYFFRVLTIL